MSSSSVPSVHSQTHDDDSDTCLPPEVIVNEDSDSDTNQIGRICNSALRLGFPNVFHSKLNVVKITYTWVENHSSGFTVTFDFHHYNSSCVHICDDRVCLSDRQVCNGLYECEDKSDEQGCLPSSPSVGASQSTTNVDLLKTFAAIISLVLMPGLLIIICVVSPCPIRSRMFRRHRRSRERLDHSQLRPDSQVSEVCGPLSAPSTSQDKLLQHQISQVRQHQERVRSVQTDTMLDLPPHIPRSKDGEEGFVDSQRHLYNKKPKYFDQVFRPPPNKTVYDRESPPPYYSNTSSLENLGSPANRIVRDTDGAMRVLRCNSMSSNVTAPLVVSNHREVQKQTSAKSHSRTLSTNTPSVGPARTHSSPVSTNRRMDEPPGYDGVCSSDNNNQVSLQVDSV